VRLTTAAAGGSTPLTLLNSCDVLRGVSDILVVAMLGVILLRSRLWHHHDRQGMPLTLHCTGSRIRRQVLRHAWNVNHVIP
jgi:hypothetical protein